MSELYIIGAGGHGVVVAELAALLGYHIAGFIDADHARHGTQVLHWPVLGGYDALPAGAVASLGIGDNHAREAIATLASARQWRLLTLIHPSAVISPSVIIGAGVIILAQTAVNARTRIGAGCILNTACSVDHDCTLGSFAHIAPGVHLAGGITIGAGTLMGVGSCARPGISIGANAIIGAGSVVIHDFPDAVVAYGNPARIHGMDPTANA